MLFMLFSLFIRKKFKNSFTRINNSSYDYQRKINENYIAHPIIKHQYELGDAPLSISNKENYNKSGKWKLLVGPSIKGSWNSNNFIKTKALLTDENTLYVGLLADGDDATVWKFSHDKWDKIGGEGVRKSWNKANYVTVLEKYQNSIYAGVDNQIWQYRNGEWENITPSDILPKGVTVYSMEPHQGKLYVGLTGGKPSILIYNGKTWSLEKLNTKLTGATGIYELLSHTDGNLYAGTIMRLGFSAFVLKKEQGRWSVAGGNGVNNSWINTGNAAALSLTSYKEYLIVTFNRRPMAEGAFSPIWAFNGKSWNPVGARNIPPSWSKFENFNASINFNEKLIISAGGQPAGLSSLWEWRGDKWLQIAGNGINKSWGKNNQPLSNGLSNSEYIYRMVKSGNNALYLGFGDGLGMAQIWRYTTP